MKKLIMAVSLVLMFFLGACMATDANAEQNHPLKIWAENSNGCYRTFCVVDDNTGVNYVVVSANWAGQSDFSIAITPRLNADGSLYVTN